MPPLRGSPPHRLRGLSTVEGVWVGLEGVEAISLEKQFSLIEQLNTYTMPSKLPLEQGEIYHIYNRGINSCSIFTREAHYMRFLQLYQKHCAPAFDTYAYALMGNHFHLLVRVKEVLPTFDELYPHLPQGTLKGLQQIKPNRQLGNCLNAYAQYFNRSTKRTGSLLETPFERKEIINNDYFTRMVAYIHNNPVKHGIVRDFRDYPYTSFHGIQSQKHDFLDVATILEWFGGIERFLSFHR